MEALDKINKLPLNPMIEQATSTLSESQRTMKNLQTTLDSMNKILASQSMQQLPTDMQSIESQHAGLPAWLRSLQQDGGGYAAP